MYKSFGGFHLATDLNSFTSVTDYRCIAVLSSRASALIFAHCIDP